MHTNSARLLWLLWLLPGFMFWLPLKAWMFFPLGLLLLTWCFCLKKPTRFCLLVLACTILGACARYPPPLLSSNLCPLPWRLPCVVSLTPACILHRGVLKVEISWTMLLPSRPRCTNSLSNSLTYPAPSCLTCVQLSLPWLSISCSGYLPSADYHCR